MKGLFRAGLIAIGVSALLLAYGSLANDQAAKSNKLYAKLTDKELKAEELKRVDAKDRFIAQGEKSVMNEKYDEAVIYFQRALRIDPEDKNVKAALNKAMAKYRGEFQAKAEAASEDLDVDSSDVSDVVAEKTDKSADLDQVDNAKVEEKRIAAEKQKVQADKAEIEKRIAVEKKKAEAEKQSLALEKKKAAQAEIERLARVKKENEKRLALQKKKAEAEKQRLARAKREKAERIAAQKKKAEADKQRLALEKKKAADAEKQRLVAEKQKKEDEKAAALRKTEQKRIAKEKNVNLLIEDAEKLYGQKKYSKAMKQASKASALDPDNINVQLLRDKIQKGEQVSLLLEDGRKALAKGELDKARDFGKDLTSVSPQDPEVKSYLLKVKAAEDKAAAQLKQQQTAQELSEAQSALAQNDVAAAKMKLAEVLRIDPANQEAKNILAQIERKEKSAQTEGLKKQLVVYRAEGDYVNAIKTCDEILSVNPDDQEIIAMKNVCKTKLAELKAQKNAIAQETLQKQIEDLLAQAKKEYKAQELDLARQKWQKVLELDPNNDEAYAAMKNTDQEFQKFQVEAAKKEEVKQRKLQARSKLYSPITITFTDIQLADFLNQLSLLSDVNFTVAQGGDASVSGRFANTPLLDVLNAVLIPNGFRFETQDDKIIVIPDLVSKTINLNQQQTAQLSNLEEKKIIAELLYGPTKEPNIVGQKYIFDPRKHLFIMVDSKMNISKIENMLENLPQEIVPQLETRMYTLKREVGEKVKLLLTALLDAESDHAVKQLKGRQILFEDTTNTLVVRDTLKNLQLSESFLKDKEFIEKVQSDELVVRVFPIANKKMLQSDPNKARELAKKTTELVETLLYNKTGKSQARKNGRQVWLNEEFGTLTVMDNQRNIDRVADFLVNSQFGDPDVEVTEIIYVDYVDASELQAKLYEILGFGSGSSGGDTGNRVIRRVRPDSSFRFRDAEVQCLRIRDIGTSSSSSSSSDRDDDERDFDAEVQLLVSTPSDVARTVTIREREGVQQFGDYMIRVPDSNPRGSGWADVEIQYISVSDQMDNEVEEDDMQQDSEITITPYVETSSLIIRTSNPALLTSVKYWISVLDAPIKQVSIETKYVTVAEDAALKLNSQLTVNNFSNGIDLAGAKTSMGFPGGSTSSVANLVNGASIADSAAINNQPASTVFNLIANNNLSWNLELLETKGKAQVVTGPMLTIQNGKSGTFDIYREFDSVERVSYTDVTYEEQEVEELALDITPTITKNNIIKLSLEITMEEFIPGSPELENGGADDDSVLFDVDKISVSATRNDSRRREINTTVQLRDGQTISLGGFKAEHSQQNVSRIPILGDIPLIGRVLFSQQQKQRKKANLLILLTAYLND